MAFEDNTGITGEELRKEDKKKVKTGFRRTTGDIVFESITYVVFALFTISCIFPFYYLFINTISDNSLVVRGAIQFIPKGIHFDNYSSILTEKKIFQAFAVTVSRTVIATTLMVLASGFIGFLVTQEKMWNRRFWYRFMIITMYFNAGTIPWYMNMRLLGLTNNYLAYIIPGIVAPYNIILVKTYIESIPSELEESAFIDGASYMTVFRKIVWPLCTPILATIAIFGAVGNWNSFTDSLMLMRDSSAEKYRTLQHLLYNTLQQTAALQAQVKQGGSPDQVTSSTIVQYTISMVTIIPILLVYPFMQRYLTSGIMLGAVKG